MLDLQRPKPNISDRTKRKRQGEPNIASKPRQANVLPYRSYEPHLSHAENGAYDAKTKGADGGDAGGQFGRLVVDLGAIAEEASFEEEVFADCDAFVDGEPIALR